MTSKLLSLEIFYIRLRGNKLKETMIFGTPQLETLPFWKIKNKRWFCVNIDSDQCLVSYILVFTLLGLSWLLY